MSRVRDVMTREPKTVGRHDRRAMTDEVMKAERIRLLPVLGEDGSLTGTVSQRDLFQSALVRARAYESASRDKVLDSILVKEGMTDEVEITTSDTPPRHGS
jgi:CBS-domain-containing membrane protein